MEVKNIGKVEQKKEKLCVYVLRKTQRNHYSTLKNNITGNQKCWKTVKRVFSNKLVSISREEISLVENEKNHNWQQGDSKSFKLFFFSNVIITVVVNGATQCTF